VLGTLFGVLMGPHVAGIFDPRGWGSSTDTVTLEVMRVVLATGLFAIGVELPQSYLRDHARGLLVMVVPTMAFGWVIIAGMVSLFTPTLTQPLKCYLPFARSGRPRAVPGIEFHLVTRNCSMLNAD
jgi:NhaP-type Na+/H+ or K+/H+ antiporter